PPVGLVLAPVVALGDVVLFALAAWLVAVGLPAVVPAVVPLPSFVAPVWPPGVAVFSLELHAHSPSAPTTTQVRRILTSFMDKPARGGSRPATVRETI